LYAVNSEKSEKLNAAVPVGAIDNIESKYAAAQIATAHANSNFSLATRRIKTLQEELSILSASYHEQSESYRVLQNENTTLATERKALLLKLDHSRAELRRIKAPSLQTADHPSLTTAELEQAHAEISKLRQQLHQKEQELQSLRHSISFRLGCRITQTINRIPGTNLLRRMRGD
jgi:chromosome segregation ATPase